MSRPGLDFVDRHNRSVGARPRRPATLAIGLMAILGACAGPPLLEPHTVGVVAEVDRRPGDIVLVTLEDGQAVQIDGVSRANLEGGAEPKEGTLLLLGESDGGIWFDVLFPDSDPPVTPCWTASWFGRTVDGAIQFDNGLRLPTVPDFDGSLGSSDGRFVDPFHRFCLNERGEVTAYR